ncbi:MAG TPA: tetratricopeptide repeat protein, partial [Myxococcaceae bacterium]|nr:tetratricopeptide repeat protein [Myxococcaceae bacterium]
YETMFDDGRRVPYLASLERTSAPKPVALGGAKNEADAVEAYKIGEVLFRKRDYTGADAQFTRAHALDPKATYLAARAWSIYMDPARKAQSAAAKQMMNDAVRTDPECDRAHYQLGVIARVEGDMDRAERHFREAIRANPRHLEANQELRLIDMRKKNAGKKGLFG